MNSTTAAVGVLCALVVGSARSAAGEQSPTKDETNSEANRATEPVPAQSKRELVRKVEELHAEGSALYRAGAYREAIDRFRRAHALYPGPNIVYNLARCYEALGEIDRAIAYFERVSTDPKTKPRTRRKAEDKLRMLRRAQALGQAAPAPSPEARAPRRPARKHRPAAGRGRRTAAWVTAGVTGLLAAGAGIALGFTLAADHKLDGELKQYPGSKEDLDRARDRLRVRAVVTDVLAGAALIAGAFTLYLFLRGSSASEQPSSDLSFAIGLAGPGAVVQTRF